MKLSVYSMNLIQTIDLSIAKIFTCIYGSFAKFSLDVARDETIFFPTFRDDAAGFQFELEHSAVTGASKFSKVRIRLVKQSTRSSVHARNMYRNRRARGELKRVYRPGKGKEKFNLFGNCNSRRWCGAVTVVQRVAASVELRKCLVHMLQLAPTASLLSDAVAARRASPISIGEKHQLLRSLVMAIGDSF